MVRMDELIKKMHAQININGITFKPFSLLDDAEIEAVWKMRNHPDIACWMINTEQIPFEQHLSFIRNQKSQKRNFNFLAQANGSPAGVISLHDVDFTKKFASVGIYKNPENLTPLTGMDLLAGLCNIAFNFAHLKKLKLEVFEDNTRAIKLYHKAGFHSKGTSEKKLERGNQFLYMIKMEIIDREWKKHECNHP